MPSPAPDDSTSRGWTDRRFAEGEVPEKIKKISGWKRAMKDFMHQDTKLNDLVALFTQKFVQLGSSKNFTLSTLMDMAWTVLVLTWEAVVAEKLPVLDQVERGFREKYEDLKTQMATIRLEFLGEISESRDRERLRLAPGLQEALNEVSNDMQDHNIYRFTPEVALDPTTAEYFQKAMAENLKVAMSKGAAAGNEQLQSLLSELAAAEAENRRLQVLLDDALLKAELAEGAEPEPVKVPRKPSVPWQGGMPEAEVAKLRETIAAQQRDLDESSKQNGVFRQMTKELGVDLNRLPPEEFQEFMDGGWRQFAKNLLSAGGDDAAANEQDASNRRKKEEEMAREMAELRKKIALLEQQLQDGKGADKDFDKEKARLEAKIKEFQEEVKQLKEALESLKSAGKPAKDDGVAKKRIEELEKEVAALKKTLSLKGDSAQQALLQKMQELEAELSRANFKVDLLQKELDLATKNIDALRPELAQTKKELKRVQDELDAKNQDGGEKVKEKKEKKPDPPADESPGSRKPRDDSQMEELAAKYEKTKAKLMEALKELEALRLENKDLQQQLEEANIMKKAIEAAMEELRKKFEDFKNKLKAAGVDVSLLDAALEQSGMNVLLNPMSVFDRLYSDALRRHKKYAFLSKEQALKANQALKQHGLLVENCMDGTEGSAALAGGFSGEGDSEGQGLRYCPHCGLNLRSPPGSHPSPRGRSKSPSNSLQRQRSHSPSDEAGRPTTAGSGSRSTLPLFLDVVAHKAFGDPTRKAFAVVSEAEDYFTHQLPGRLSRTGTRNVAVRPVSRESGERQRSSSPEGQRNAMSQTLPTRLHRKPQIESEQHAPAIRPLHEGSFGPSPDFNLSMGTTPSAAASRARSPPPRAATANLSTRSQTAPGRPAVQVVRDEKSSSGLFEFPGLGDARASRELRAPPAPPRSHPRESAMNLDLGADDRRSRPQSQPMVVPLMLPLQQLRKASSGPVGQDEADTAGGKAPPPGAAHAVPQAPSPPFADPPKPSYLSLQLGGLQAISPLASSKASHSGMLPQIQTVTPARSGRPAAITLSQSPSSLAVGSGACMLRSHTVPSLGSSLPLQAPQPTHHAPRLVKAASQVNPCRVLAASGSRSDIHVMGVRQTPSAAQTPSVAQTLSAALAS